MAEKGWWSCWFVVFLMTGDGSVVSWTEEAKRMARQDELEFFHGRVLRCKTRLRLKTEWRFSMVCWTRFGQMLRVRLEKMSSYVGSLAASRVHHDRKVQFFGWNIEMPSQVCCGMLLQFFDRKKQGKVRGFGEWVKSVFEAAANARPESEEDMMLSQKPGFS